MLEQRTKNLKSISKLYDIITLQHLFLIQNQLEAYKESIKRDKYLVVSYFEGGNCGVILNQLHEALDMYSKAYEVIQSWSLHVIDKLFSY